MKDGDNYVHAEEAAETYYTQDGTEIDATIYEYRTVPGFYYDDFVLGAGNSVELSIESQEIEGMARVEGTTLYLSDLSEDENGAYVVLRLSITNIANPDIAYTWLYRVRVYANFAKGRAVYPYSTEAEYLDQFSEYYSSADRNYVIDIEEIFGEGVKASSVGYQRFEDSEVEYTEVSYAISDVRVNGASVSNFASYAVIDGTELTIIASNTGLAFDVEIKKSYTRDGVEMLGADLTYLFKINQSTTYVPVVKVYEKAMDQGLAKQDFSASYEVVNGEK